MTVPAKKCMVHALGLVSWWDRSGKFRRIFVTSSSRALRVFFGKVMKRGQFFSQMVIRLLVNELAGGRTELFNLMSAILFGLWLGRQCFHRSHRIRCYSPARASNDENPPLRV